MTKKQKQECPACGNKYLHLNAHIKNQHEVCGRCSKPKGEGEGTCNCGRPTKYKEEYIDKVDDYLDQAIDKEVEVVKEYVDEDGEKKSETKEKRQRVQLPTIEGFALFIDVPVRTLHDWKDEHDEFSQSLGKIKTQQKMRLFNKGLSSDYNSKIASLILSSNHGMKERKDYTSDDEPIGDTSQLDKKLDKWFDKQNTNNANRDSNKKTNEGDKE